MHEIIRLILTDPWIYSFLVFHEESYQLVCKISLSLGLSDVLLGLEAGDRFFFFFLAAKLGKDAVSSPVHQAGAPSQFAPY